MCILSIVHQYTFWRVCPPVVMVYNGLTLAFIIYAMLKIFNGKIISCFRKNINFVIEIKDL